MQAQTIQIDSAFTADGEIFPFEPNDTIYGLSISGSVTLSSDTSLVRVILTDNAGHEWMVYEAYPMIVEDTDFEIEEECDETCFLDQLLPYSIIIQVIDASLDFESLLYSKYPKEDAIKQQFESKRSKDAEKIEAINQHIPSYNMNWVAGDNSIVALYYDQKRNMFGDGYNLRGYEYYCGGVFESLGHSAYPKASPDLVWNFDWRNRHGANDPLSLYWDGDALGTGWLTGVKHQGYKCVSCWAFSSVGVTEALTNLYNAYYHPDYDLSEQDLVSCSGAGSCSGGHSNAALKYVINSGIVTEDCFPYDSSNLACDSPPKCSDPNPVIKISDTLIINDISHDSIRIALIKYGPLVFNYQPSGSMYGHSVTLSGFQFNPIDSTINWIFKDSYGITVGDKGFRTMPIPDITSVLAAIGPVLSNNLPLSDTCYNKDGDDYFFWGIGTKPENCNCSDIEDCDDNNRMIGGYDENYNCPCVLEFISTLRHIRRDTIWNESVDINQKIVVDSGACLTIRSTAFFSPEAQILVYQGGKLVIDGGVLTNACPETLWEGIVVYGYDTAQYYNQYFGVVNIINEGTIENARIGISTNYCPLCMQPQSSGGGIIRADGAIFRNNGIAVEFTPFRNIYQGLEKPYMASFTKCLFEYGGYLLDTSDFKCFIKLNQVNGVRIQGSDFISNDLSTYSNKEITHKYRSGIYAVGSRFYVEEACLEQSLPCNQSKPSLFRGLNYGIYALGIDVSNTVTVKKSIFDKNKTGIYLSAINYATIVQDTFEVLIENYYNDTVCGIYLDYCTGYQVEENIFHGDYYYEFMGSPKKRVGVVINNSGEEYNEIYNNTFDSLYIGTLALNNNRDKDGLYGLQIKCNDYTNGYYDIAATAKENQNESGIAENQGSNGLLPSSPANNTFSYSSPINHNSVSDYANECQNIIYWHLKDTISANTKPKYHSVPEVDPQLNPLNTYNYIKDTCCPSSFGSGGGGSIEGLRLAMSENETKSDSVKSLLGILVDGGDTYQMALDIQTSIPNEADVISESLLSNSPYLSDSVMLSAIEQENVLTPAMITGVLCDNPQAAKSDTIQQALDNRVQLLTEEQRIDIDQGWFITGAKEDLEASYVQFSGEKTKAFNSLIRSFKNDTLLVNPFDSIVDLYSEDNAIYSKYCLALEYLGKGDTLNAENVLTSIPSNFNMTDEDLLKHQHYIDYLDLLVQSGIYRGFDEIDSTYLVGFNSIFASSEGEIKALTRNLLLSTNSIVYNEPYVFPEQGLKSGNIKRIPIKRMVTGNSLKLYPNPARNYVIVDYSLVEPVSDGFIKVLDISGKLYHNISIHKSREYLIIPINDIPNGIYIFQLVPKNSPIISKKLIINK